LFGGFALVYFGFVLKGMIFISSAYPGEILQERHEAFKIKHSRNTSSQTAVHSSFISIATVLKL